MYMVVVPYCDAATTKPTTTPVTTTVNPKPVTTTVHPSNFCNSTKGSFNGTFGGVNLCCKYSAHIHMRTYIYTLSCSRACALSFFPALSRSLSLFRTHPYTSLFFSNTRSIVDRLFSMGPRLA